MKNSTFTAMVLCLSFGTVLGAMGSAEAEQYQIVTEEWAPYNYLDDDQLSGMTTDIIRAIMALTGDDFEMHLVPSMRASRALDNRPRTIMYSMYRTPEREARYKWVGPIVDAAIYPYQLTSAPQQITSLEQLLRAPRITTRHAGLVPDLLESLGLSNVDRSATRSHQLYRMLLARRTDIIVGDTDAGVAYHSRALDIAPGTLRRIPLEIYRESLFIAFTLDCDDDLVASWAQALEELRESGELERIQLSYQ